jgi:hypothetical protein
MPKNSESLNRTLFDLLHSRGYDPTMLDTSGKEIPTPEEAEVFQFDFIKDGENYGKVTISIDGAHKLIIYFNESVADSEKEDSGDGDISWYKLLNQLKRFAQSYQLSFELRNVNNLKHDMAKRDYMKKKESIAEGYYPMGKKASYSDAVPSVKIVLQHTRQIEEGEQRYRNVARIFLENEQGERFLAPTTKPGIARVYARHIAEGGQPHDDRWNHISSLCEEYQKMGAFVRATRSGQFNESAQRLVAEGINHYQKLRESLSKLAGHRGYNAYFESYTPALMEDEESVDLSEMFMSSSLDPRIESVMPILSKLSKNVMEMSEINELNEWADSLIEDESITSSNPQGIPEGRLDGEADIDSPVADAITRRILMQRTDLLAKYGPEAVADAIANVAEGLSDWIGPDDEIGSSDVSGWVKRVEQELSSVEEGTATKTKTGLKHSGHYGTEFQPDDTRDEYGHRVRGAPHIAGAKKPGNTGAGKGRPTKGDNLSTSDLPPDAFGRTSGKIPKGKTGKVHTQTDESIADDYEDMSDRELMRHAGMLGLEKNCVPDDEGGLANRREIIYLLQKEAEGDLDEALDPEKKQRLQDLIDRYADATDPEYMGDDDYEDIIAQIRQEFGDRTADSIANGPSMHFPRPGHSMGHDDLEFKQMRKNLSPNRITKAGKLHKQDSDAMKRDIKNKFEVEEGLGDVAKKVGSALKTGAKAVGKAIVGPDDEELLQNLKKAAGVRNPETGKPSMAHSDVEKVNEGEANLEKALDSISGSWSHWIKDDSTDPNIESYWYDDGEGNYYASGRIEHDLRTGKITVDFEGEEGEEVKGTFDSVGAAMNALRGGYSGGHGSGKAPNYDSLANKTLAGPDDLYKTDKAGKKGTLTKSRMQSMKASSPYTMRGGPKGPLPEGMAEGKEDKIAQLKKDHATAVHWSKNETSPQKREAARQKAEKIKRHLETQYKQGVAEGEFAGDYKIGPEGQWRNKGPKANKPAKVGDLVGASESIQNTLNALTEMDSEGYKGTRDDDHIKGKDIHLGDKDIVKPKDMVKKGVKELTKQMDKAHKKDVKEGQEDLNAIMRLLGK